MSSRKGASNTKVFVGKISKKTRASDLEDEFSRFGKIRDLEMKGSYAFIEFDDPKDAEDAIHDMDGRTLDNSRISVQFAGAHKRDGTKGPTDKDVCYNCGKKGHWANECREGDWKNRCYRCGKKGHTKRDCTQSRSRSRSRSRSKSSSRESSRHKSSKRRHRSRTRSRDRSRSYDKSRDRASKKKDSRKERSPSSKSKSRSRSRSNSNSRSRSKSTDGNDKANGNDSKK